MADNKSFLERLSEKIAPPSKELNMNADRVGLAAQGVTREEYNPGVSQEEIYRQQQAQKVADQNAIANMIAKNREYNAARKDAGWGGTSVDAGKKYKMVTPEQIIENNNAWHWDGPAGSNSNDPISVAFRNMEMNSMNKGRETVNRYQDSIDPGLAAKWTADRESFR